MLFSISVVLSDSVHSSIYFHTYINKNQACKQNIAISIMTPSQPCRYRRWWHISSSHRSLPVPAWIPPLILVAETSAPHAECLYFFFLFSESYIYSVAMIHLLLFWKKIDKFFLMNMYFSYQTDIYALILFSSQIFIFVFLLYRPQVISDLRYDCSIVFLPSLFEIRSIVSHGYLSNLKRKSHIFLPITVDCIL